MIFQRNLDAPELGKRIVTEHKYARIEAGMSILLTADLAKAYERDIKRRWGRQTEVFLRAEPGWLWALIFYSEKGRGLNRARARELHELLDRERVIASLARLGGGKDT